ncbi:MAG: DUF5818 domain-containing protein [Terriglobales bacterium]
MTRRILPATVALAISLAPIAWAQNSKASKAQTRQGLIAWTRSQKAEPMPATQTPNRLVAQPDDAQKQPAAQAFSGMIIKSGDTYVLQTVDNITYQLDDQERAKTYEGKQVQVTGSLDKTSNTIKVRDIKQVA